ncbi:MAG TPA: RNA polymerase sigma factor [Pirellulales bacterium]|nr:RNA polymerase sigma factor [Pirellulales bacterium]
MAINPEFQALLERVKSGDQEAGRLLFERFTRRLIGLARTRLDSAVGGRVDPEDVVQSAYKSFFVRLSRGDFQLDDWGNAWGVLTTITLRKCGHRIEYLRAACRNIALEAASPASPDDSVAAWEPIARGPTPAEAISLAELVERLLDGLDARDRQIELLRLQGFTEQEIAVQVGRTDRTVRNVLARTRARLERLLDDERS